MSKILRLLRESKNWTIKDVATDLEMTEHEYEQMENGEARITINVAQKLSELYRIAPEFFLGNEAQLINYNIGTYSKGVIHAVTFNEYKNPDADSDK